MKQTLARLPLQVARKWTLTRAGGGAGRSSLSDIDKVPEPWIDAIVGPDTSLMVGTGEARRGWVIDAVEPGALRRIATYEAEYPHSGPVAALVIDPSDRFGRQILTPFDAEAIDFEIGLRLRVYTVVVAAEELIRGAVAQLDIPGMAPIPAGGGWFAVVAAGGVTVVAEELLAIRR